MKNKTRIEYIALNSTISIIINILSMVFLFINRTILIKIMGIEILGLTNFVTSVIGVLSLTELGIGIVMTYTLYKPISEGDIAKRNAFLNLHRKIYKIVSFSLFIIGVLSFPFLKYFTSENIYEYRFYSIYFLFLINSCIGYLMFAYKRSLLEAKQQKYVLLMCDFIVLVIFSIIKWFLLYYNGNYTVYLILTIISTIISNLIISYIVGKNDDVTTEISKITKDDKESIKANIMGGFTGQLASIIVFSTDNLLISKFLGVFQVGLYGNYTLISNALSSIISQITHSHVATVGNLISTESNLKVENSFRKYNFLTYVIVYVCSLMILGLITPFIKIWLGVDFVLNNLVVYLLSIYFYVNCYRNSISVFIGGYGLYWKQKNKSIVEAILNIMFSLIYLIKFKMGMSGILLGTICSNIFVNTWFEPFIVYKYGFKMPIGNFIKVYIKQTLIYIFSFIVVVLIDFPINNIFDWIFYSIANFIVIIIPIFVFYGKTDEFKYIVSYIKKTTNSFNKRHKR